MLKNGAAFDLAGPSVQTRAIGRGATALAISFVCGELSSPL